MTKRQLRYIANRDAILKAVRERREANLRYPVYVKLLKVRSKLDNIRRSLELYRYKIQLKKRQQERLIRVKEELELAWGQTRARLKREQANTTDNKRLNQRASVSGAST